MNLNGEETFKYDISDVWTALHNTNMLSKAIPGCKSMTATGSNNYVVAVSLGVAAVKGEYEGKVKVIDVKSPLHFMIEGEGAGSPGFVKVKMNCFLERTPSGTLMKWDCDATVGGLIASIGGRVLSGISKFMAKQFFKAFKDEMAKSMVAKAA
jgi:carbon monoxide dehydrogenase subunit G